MSPYQCISPVQPSKVWPSELPKSSPSRATSTGQLSIPLPDGSRARRPSSARNNPDLPHRANAVVAQRIVNISLTTCQNMRRSSMNTKQISPKITMGPPIPIARQHLIQPDDAQEAAAAAQKVLPRPGPCTVNSRKALLPFAASPSVVLDRRFRRQSDQPIEGRQL